MQGPSRKQAAGDRAIGSAQSVVVWVATFDMQRAAAQREGAV
jgi:hypothetical protein